MTGARQEMLPARLTLAQRQIVAELLPALADRLLLDTKNQRTLEFTRRELDDIKRRAAGALGEATGGSRRNSLRHIRDITQTAIQRYELDKAITATAVIFRFKIVLMDSQPAIWRQIEVPDGTLDDLHEHIQTAMGWTNSHLHQFVIDDECYGDPELLNDGLYERETIDSTQTQLGLLFGKVRARNALPLPIRLRRRLGARSYLRGLLRIGASCEVSALRHGAWRLSAEDVGGMRGYAEFLDAIRDPRHEDHKDMLEWVGRRFDPEKLLAAAATKEMHRGLPDWRDYA